MYERLVNLGYCNLNFEYILKKKFNVSLHETIFSSLIHSNNE